MVNGRYRSQTHPIDVKHFAQKDLREHRRKILITLLQTGKDIKLAKKLTDELLPFIYKPYSRIKCLIMEMIPEDIYLESIYKYLKAKNEHNGSEEEIWDYVKKEVEKKSVDPF